MEKYSVGGMSCAACSARVEKAVKKVSGVTECSVNLLTNSLTVDGDFNNSDIKKAVKNAGYYIIDNSKKSDDDLEDKTTKPMIKRLIYSSVFLIILMYFSMGHTMWNWPVPNFFDNNYIAIGITELLLTIAVMIINKNFFISGFKALIKRSPNMDSLVALGSAAGFVYSIYALFKMTVVPQSEAIHLIHEFYFESSAMILTLITVGKTLESYSKGKTTSALKGLMKLKPKTAIKVENGEEVTVPIDSVKVGDIIRIYAGKIVPVDAVVLSGNAAIDESALTGESIPTDKSEGDTVSAGTILKSGFLECKAEKIGEDTTISQIIKLVNDASATKAPIAKIADKVSGIFVPTVIIISVITLIGWLIAGQAIGYSLERAISVLVISCPCALGLATPVAIMVGNGIGAKNGIIFKNAVSLENLGKTQIVVLDKTGTITLGEPKVTDIIPCNDTDKSEFIKIAYSLEKKSEHPLAKAIVEEGNALKSDIYEITDYQTLTGNGITGLINGISYYGGSGKFIKEKVGITADEEKLIKELSDCGKTPLLFSDEEKLLGIIAVADTVKEDSPKAIKELQDMNIRVVMLTGDNKNTARVIAEKCNVDEVIAEVLPDKKAEVVAELKKYGKVAMVGDGINDAPALITADSSVAIGAGSDIAIDSADIVIMKSVLTDLSATIRLSKLTIRNIYENLFWAFIYNIIGIPLATGLFINIFGWSLNPMFAAAAMSLSSFCVVSNALRLNLYDISKPRFFKNGKKISINPIKEKTMEKTVKVEGMMCPHCEAHVKEALEKIDEVVSAIPSHENNTVIITLSSEIDNGKIKEAIEKAGYKYLG